MRVTKHEHAALLVEDGGKALIIDPGSFTSPFTDLHDVVGIVITHEHQDHWTPEHLERILKYTGPIPIFGPAGVVAAASAFDVTEVHPGDTVELDPFTLRFFGGKHAVIHKSLPVVDNVGVLVNDEFYYPGDSYAVPEGVDVKLLAAPVGAPWLKIGEAMDYVLAVKPRRLFGTHDMTLSMIGLVMHRARLAWAVEQNGGEYVELDPGDSADV
ncbi:MBL fold metallo-hydrolase [Microbacterium sp. ASV49]|uniref:MBL fold metallo-hydrolase n=1 Tax=Microbacterium candidum TaxID=3041922 RepID=A0ABT7N010_9MICO|nr:MBL fold metallo-hydrolase [Microbacterium sp. ASV49]MDL9980032.1 MBL fold metallo-hydrolase [Microbacterium sp. ASV49]